MTLARLRWEGCGDRRGGSWAHYERKHASHFSLIIDSHYMVSNCTGLHRGFASSMTSVTKSDGNTTAMDKPIICGSR